MKVRVKKVVWESARTPTGFWILGKYSSGPGRNGVRSTTGRREAQLPKRPGANGATAADRRETTGTETETAGR